jgi:hypothetical protein
MRESEVASAWLVAQQAAEIVGEVGGGVGGLAAAVHVATHLKGSKQGGFKWSSQRLTGEGCDGQAGWVDDGVDGQGAVEVAGGAVVAA